MGTEMNGRVGVHEPVPRDRDRVIQVGNRVLIRSDLAAARAEVSVHAVYRWREQGCPWLPGRRKLRGDKHASRWNDAARAHRFFYADEGDLEEIIAARDARRKKVDSRHLPKSQARAEADEETILREGTRVLIRQDLAAERAAVSQATIFNWLNVRCPWLPRGRVANGSDRRSLSAKGRRSYLRPFIDETDLKEIIAARAALEGTGLVRVVQGGLTYLRADVAAQDARVGKGSICRWIKERCPWLERGRKALGIEWKVPCKGKRHQSRIHWYILEADLHSIVEARMNFSNAASFDGNLISMRSVHTSEFRDFSGTALGNWEKWCPWLDSRHLQPHWSEIRTPAGRTERRKSYSREDLRTIAKRQQLALEAMRSESRYRDGLGTWEHQRTMEGRLNLPRSPAYVVRQRLENVGATVKVLCLRVRVGPNKYRFGWFFQVVPPAPPAEKHGDTEQAAATAGHIAATGDGDVTATGGKTEEATPPRQAPSAPRLGRPRKGETDRDTFVVAALAVHHRYEAGGSVGDYQAATVRGLVNANGGLTISAVSRFFGRFFRDERRKGYKGYVAACAEKRIGRLLASWQRESPEHLAPMGQGE